MKKTQNILFFFQTRMDFYYFHGDEVEGSPDFDKMLVPSETSTETTENLAPPNKMIFLPAVVRRSTPIMIDLSSLVRPYSEADHCDSSSEDEGYQYESPINTMRSIHPTDANGYIVVDRWTSNPYKAPNILSARLRRSSSSYSSASLGFNELSRSQRSLSTQLKTPVQLRTSSSSQSNSPASRPRPHSVFMGQTPPKETRDVFDEVRDTPKPKRFMRKVMDLISPRVRAITRTTPRTEPK